MNMMYMHIMFDILYMSYIPVHVVSLVATFV